MSRSPQRSKTCAVCGRRMVWRKAWERSWDEVRYCSAGCRKRRRRPVDRKLEDAILGLLSETDRNGSICPTDAARLVGSEQWRSLVEPARAAARRLHAKGRIQILQDGRPVDASTARGPIRLANTN
ncbi:MAG: DUF3253 domain-containing protein [Acidimicrobiales bacterium]